MEYLLYLFIGTLFMPFRWVICGIAGVFSSTLRRALIFGVGITETTVLLSQLLARGSVELSVAKLIVPALSSALTVTIFRMLSQKIEKSRSKPSERAKREEQEQENREQQERAKWGEQERVKREQQERTKREEEDELDNRSNEEILGLSRGWNQEDLKAAYHSKCHQLHPDKWGKMPAQIRFMMEKEFKKVQQAYKNLSK